MDKWMYGEIDGRMARWMDVKQIDSWGMDSGRMNRWMGGWIGWKDG